MNGILLINKPKGLTSHDVVYKVKRKLNLDKVGHTGTLDPFATGLLILLIGKATKLAFLFDDLDKSYEGNLIFGKEFDTNDFTGEVILEKEANFTINTLKEKMHSFIPSYEQMPPLYSAIKVGGMKSYEAARQGKTLELKTRLVNIYNFDLINEENYHFIAEVSKGTYIRSLARDLGYKLNTYAALSTLNRLTIGNYHLKDAKTIDEVSLDDLITDNELFSGVREVKLNDYMIKLVKNGVYLDERQTTLDTPFIVVDDKNNKIAYYEKEKDKFRPLYLF
ncbi:tRNA pseudouridine(55) synthase TruB [Acholeplasma hippikon]|uniref:tRNA pseudouridine synthase B n=1 Tax=Acholeplasma hippikon TaxID=264636 RepID=A0A449BJ55_9MOLU|nr:tRNA pseudouridine(55) synthase TruB [Acholeplasma hippikon]VEU82501.1 tRNA pseudouridine synthase B [Acholeplasma hippikon]